MDTQTEPTPAGGTAEAVSDEAERRLRSAARRHAVLMVLAAAAVFSLAGALVKGLKTRGHRAAQEISGPEDLAATLRDVVMPGDMVICLGAGDITKWAAGLADAIATGKDKP